MNSTPDPEPRPPDGPRFPTLLDQMRAWYTEQLARNAPPPTPPAQRQEPRP